ncbi:MAG: LysE family translocator [Magnetovibrio sp.]|nr:LysE family translocator [Magnetovibrio sp.]
MDLLDWAIPVIVFGASSTFTPGPNNVMITASGVNFGFRRSIPHMLGIAIGFAVMNLAVGMGLGQVFETYPKIHLVLKYISIAYLTYLAWKIATSDQASQSSSTGKPFTFIQAAAFQWVNPKAWVVAIGAVSTFTTVGGDLLFEVMMMSLIFMLVTIPSASTWAMFGIVIRRFLQTPKRLRAFNWSMAGLLMISLVPALR